MCFVFSGGVHIGMMSKLCVPGVRIDEMSFTNLLQNYTARTVGNGKCQ